VTTDPLRPPDAPAALCELSADVRAAMLLDAAGAPVGASGVDRDGAAQLAELAGELLRTVDRASPLRPVERAEVQVDGGGVYALRGPRFTLAAVTRRSALPSLTFLDLRHVFGRIGEEEG
jgi:hypothetical protein